MDLDNLASSVKTRADLAEFVDALVDDLEVNRGEWGHQSLEGFLAVLGGSIRVLDRIYRNENRVLSEDHDWRVIADILSAARIRE